MKRDRRLVEAMARLSRVATGDVSVDFSVDDVLQQLCEVAGEALEVDGAGVMGVQDADGHRTRTRFVHSAPAMVEVERLQELLQQGPCREAVDTGRVVVVEDVAEQVDRWPEYTAQALGDHLRSVVALPLRSRGRTWGTLDLYRSAAGRWESADVDDAQLLADVAVSYLVMAQDRDEAAAAHAQLAHRSVHDDLTGLPNRALLFDRLEHALAVALRRGTTLAVVFLDVDRFKHVNDSLGHVAGDRVLVEAARRWSTTLRGGDTLARFAGDEFVLLCEDLPADPREARATVDVVVGRLRQTLLAPVATREADITVSVSIGVAISSAAVGAESLLHEADGAMYLAKQRGRNRVVISDVTPVSGPGDLGRQLEREIARSLPVDQLRVHYQPIIETAGGRTRAVEALVRWEHPQHGLLTAQTFIHLTDASGDSAWLDCWVVEQACRDLAHWRATCPDVAPDLVYCNFRPQELAADGTAEAIAASVARHGLRAADIGLEVIEDALADPLLLPVLEAYEQDGHPLSVDDFGTGYSSLSRLVAMPVDLAKIDRAFVAGLPRDPRSRRLVSAVLTVAESLDLAVVGEGVETLEQQEYLVAEGCTYLQGYLICAPVPGDELVRFLHTRPPGW